jgi:hypothetical protein
MQTRWACWAAGSALRARVGLSERAMAPQHSAGASVAHGRHDAVCVGRQRLCDVDEQQRERHAAVQRRVAGHAFVLLRVVLRRVGRWRQRQRQQRERDEHCGRRLRAELQRRWGGPACVARVRAGAYADGPARSDAAAQRQHARRQRHERERHQQQRWVWRGAGARRLVGCRAVRAWRAGWSCSGVQYQYGSSGMVETNAAWGTYVNYANCGWQLCSWPIPSSIRCASGPRRRQRVCAHTCS